DEPGGGIEPEVLADGGGHNPLLSAERRTEGMASDNNKTRANIIEARGESLRLSSSSNRGNDIFSNSETTTTYFPSTSRS
ncbi:hypothetical protein Tco_0623732, partial [Tanacetum coccineum]